MHDTHACTATCPPQLRTNPDARTADARLCVQPLACAARCLRDLHAACVVHRDLRPGHILWFPDSPGGADTSASTSGGGDRCAFVDLAYAVPCGADVPLSYTLTYAAPEIVEADARGDKTIAATPQHDEWALGVLMFEALTGHPAFDLLALGEAGVRLPGSPLLSWCTRSPKRFGAALGALSAAHSPACP